MSGSCGDNCDNFDGASTAYKRALWAVIAINGLMFAVEMSAGFAASSTALRADALDFFGDTLTYGLSMLVIGMSLQIRAKAALLKGLSLLAMGVFVAASAIWQIFSPGLPEAPMMGGIGFLALVANLLSVFILLKFKDGDSNVRSVWLCSRNDAIGNVAVMGAALLVALTHSHWPDLIVALAMSALFLSSSVQIIKHARTELNTITA
jgi:cation diffusion facilitator family transporter